jgi:ferric-dicitrate binding protein FerR (iron transport regulator)
MIMPFDNREERFESQPNTAPAWVVREHLRALSATEQRALRRWLAASTQNNRAYLKSEVAWRLAGALKLERLGLHSSNR